MKTKDLEAALPGWLKLDNVMIGKGGVVTRALAHSARDESERCMSVIFDRKGCYSSRSASRKSQKEFCIFTNGSFMYQALSLSA